MSEPLKLVDQLGREVRLRRHAGESDEAYAARVTRQVPMRFEDDRDFDRRYEVVDLEQRAEHWARMQRLARQRIRAAIEAEAIYLGDEK